MSDGRWLVAAATLTPMRAAVILAALVLAIGCGERRAPQEPIAPVAAPIADAAVPDAAPSIPEVRARQLLAARFRAAGYRIVVDVPHELEGGRIVTIDGLDPARGVGYEYLAEDEIGADLEVADGARLAEASMSVLILPAGPAEAVAHAADLFLADLAARPPAPDAAPPL